MQPQGVGGVIFAYTSSCHAGACGHVLASVELDDELSTLQADDSSPGQPLLGFQILSRLLPVLKFLPRPKTERNQKTPPSQKLKEAKTSQSLLPNPQTNIHKKQSTKTNIGE